jgi:hypothetical protein
VEVILAETRTSIRASMKNLYGNRNPRAAMRGDAAPHIDTESTCLRE